MNYQSNDLQGTRYIIFLSEYLISKYKLHVVIFSTDLLWSVMPCFLTLLMYYIIVQSFDVTFRRVASLQAKGGVDKDVMGLNVSIIVLVLVPVSQ